MALLTLVSAKSIFAGQDLRMLLIGREQELFLRVLDYSAGRLCEIAWGLPTTGELSI